MTVDEFFDGKVLPRQLFDAVEQALEAIGPAQISVSKSQVAFRRRKMFAIMWMPAQYLTRKSPNRQVAPLVLTLGFRQRDPSPRWKEIVEPSPGHFTHHLELYAIDDIDDEVRGWLKSAWEAAG